MSRRQDAARHGRKGPRKSSRPSAKTASGTTAPATPPSAAAADRASSRRNAATTSGSARGRPSARKRAARGRDALPLPTQTRPYSARNVSISWICSRSARHSCTAAPITSALALCCPPSPGGSCSRSLRSSAFSAASVSARCCDAPRAAVRSAHFFSTSARRVVSTARRLASSPAPRPRPVRIGAAVKALPLRGPWSGRPPPRGRPAPPRIPSYIRLSSASGSAPAPSPRGVLLRPLHSFTVGCGTSTPLAHRALFELRASAQKSASCARYLGAARSALSRALGISLRGIVAPLLCCGVRVESAAAPAADGPALPLFLVVGGPARQAAHRKEKKTHNEWIRY